MCERGKPPPPVTSEGESGDQVSAGRPTAAEDHPARARAGQRGMAGILAVVDLRQRGRAPRPGSRAERRVPMPPRAGPGTRPSASAHDSGRAGPRRVPASPWRETALWLPPLSRPGSDAVSAAMTAAFAEPEVVAGVADGALGPVLLGGSFAEPWPEQPASTATASAAAAPIVGTTDGFLRTVADVTSTRRIAGSRQGREHQGRRGNTHAIAVSLRHTGWFQHLPGAPGSSSPYR